MPKKTMTTGMRDMPDGQSMSLELTDTVARPGFRLMRLELFNWGTFNRRVWTLNLNGLSALLTGGNGAGKSTVVDALTTLLVPPAKVQYNKAAGADETERTARSYVFGYYKSERNEAGGSKPTQLRDLNNYTVILGLFQNPETNQAVTLAQVLYMKEGHGQPVRIYVCADKELTISRDFAGFGQDMAKLRKRLRADGAVIEEAFPKYAAWFCRRFGLDGTQPLELFNQAISMKSVSSLTSFVRERMLAPFPVQSHIDALITHFDDLHRSHEAVLKAKKQIELLTPLVAECDRHQQMREEVVALQKERDGTDNFFARMKLALLNERIDALELDWERADAAVKRLEAEHDASQARIDQLKEAVLQNGGDQLERLEGDIRREEQLQASRHSKWQRYQQAVRGIGDIPATDDASFVEQRARVGELQRQFEGRKERVQQQVTDATVEERRIKDLLAQGEQELTSLRSRRSKLGKWFIDLRAAMCTDLACGEEEMPYAGELIQVRPEARDWEGAAERLLGGLGVTMLVPESHYSRVVRWVNDRHLAGKFNYQLVKAGPVIGVSDVPRDALIHKLAVKPDSPFHDWLKRHLAGRANHTCCDTPEAFERASRAILRSGQIKEPGGHHVKDDRRHINDRSQDVLGWSNADKIAVLEARQATLLEQASQARGDLVDAANAARKLAQEQQNFTRLEEFTNYEDLDWGAVAVRIRNLSEKVEALREASDILKKLTEQLETERQHAKYTETKRDSARDRRSEASAKRTAAIDLRDSTAESIPADEGAAMEVRLALEVRITERRMEWFADAPALRVETCDSAAREMRVRYAKPIEDLLSSIRHSSERIVRQMTHFKGLYELETADFDASVASAGEFRDLHARLVRDDLPRFEARFKESLNVNTIREIASFNAELNNQREEIRRRIHRINESIRPIAFNEGRYIKLLHDANNDEEIQRFQQDLRACTSDTLSGSEDSQYSEAKYVQVKAIIDRFRAQQENQSEIDRAWVAKVTDVRNWFEFAASERWVADDTEHEFYPGSSGKSGGEKEKLAYTILAAGLAYQFGLKGGTPGARSFSFVCIDEAFGRAHEANAQFGLALFQQLGLQLLVVTPLEKIHVIEPFVASVGFMENKTGNDSRLLNLGIEEFKARKAEFLS